MPTSRLLTRENCKKKDVSEGKQTVPRIEFRRNSDSERERDDAIDSRTIRLIEGTVFFHLSALSCVPSFLIEVAATLASLQPTSASLPPCLSLSLARAKQMTSGSMTPRVPVTAQSERSMSLSLSPSIAHPHCHCSCLSLTWQAYSS